MIEGHIIDECSHRDDNENNVGSFAATSSPQVTGVDVCTSRSAMVELESRAKKVAHSRTGSEVATLEHEIVESLPEPDVVTALPTTSRKPKIKKKRSNVDIPNVTVTHLPPSSFHNHIQPSGSIILQECYIDHIDPYDEAGVRKPVGTLAPSQTLWSKFKGLFKGTLMNNYAPVSLQDHYPKYFDHQGDSLRLTCVETFRYQVLDFTSCDDRCRLVWIVLLLIVILMLCPLILILTSY